MLFFTKFPSHLPGGLFVCFKDRLPFLFSKSGATLPQNPVFDPDENQMEDLSVKKLKKSENYHLTQIKTDGTCYYTLLKTRKTSENYYDGLKGISILQKQGKKFVELWSSVSDGK